jgi:predicted RNase H-like nuclease (RuvC/YqgF family)
MQVKELFEGIPLAADISHKPATELRAEIEKLEDEKEKLENRIKEINRALELRHKKIKEIMEK